jgi:hypothetical protein
MFARTLAVLAHLVIFAAAYAAGVAGIYFIYTAWGLLWTLIALPIIALIAAKLLVLELAILRLAIPRPRPGVHRIGDGWHFLYELNRRIFDGSCLLVLPPLAWMYQSSNLFRVMVLKTLGANVRLSAIISGSAKIYDPYLLTVGTGAVIDDGVKIFSSSIESSKVLLFRVFIGPKAHVGASALLFPGTEIGEGSVLGMGSSTRNEMKIPSYELWVGNPASHLSKLFRPVLYTAGSTPEPRGGERDGRDRRDRGDRGDRRPPQRGGDRFFRRDGGGRQGGDFKRRGGRFERGGDRRERRPYDPNRGPRPYAAPGAPERSNAPQPQSDESSKPAEVRREDIVVSTNGGEKPYIGPIQVNRPVDTPKPDASAPTAEPQAPQAPKTE